jgi:hypothetical protein
VTSTSTRQVACTTCLTGYTTAGASSMTVASCHVCAAGYFGLASDATTTGGCTECAAGFNSSAGSTVCTACNAGYSTAGTGTSGTTTASPAMCTERAPGYTGSTTDGVTGCNVLLHRFSFNDAVGSTTVADTADVSAWGGTQKNGTVVDTVALGDGKATFTGQGYLTLPNNIMESSTAMTMEMWFTSNSSNAGYKRLFQFGATTGTMSSILLLRSGISGELYTQARLPTEYIYAESATQFNGITANAHIVAIYDPVASATIKLYINGVEIASNSASDALALAMSNYNYVGTGDNGNANERLHGVIDEFRIWRGALSASTIVKHYSWGPSSICAPGTYISADSPACVEVPAGSYPSKTIIIAPSAKGWWGICASPDFTKIAATVTGGNIWLSVDSGMSWTACPHRCWN